MFIFKKILKIMSTVLGKSKRPHYDQTWCTAGKFLKKKTGKKGFFNFLEIFDQKIAFFFCARSLPPPRSKLVKWNLKIVTRIPERKRPPPSSPPKSAGAPSRYVKYKVMHLAYSLLSQIGNL